MKLELIYSSLSGGGILMYPLAVIAVLIYFYAFRMFGFFRRINLNRVEEERCKKWVENPELAEGEVGEMIRYSLHGVNSVREIQNRFAEINASFLPRLNRRIVFLSVLVTVAPLMGLLGTVTGMFTTFRGLSENSGKVIELIASGIHEALITTQTGLVIAIPGYIMLYMLRQRCLMLSLFIGQLESAMVNRFMKEQVGG